MYIFEAKYQNMENGNERKGTIMLHDGRTEDETYAEAMRRAIQMKESFEWLCAVERITKIFPTRLGNNEYVQYQTFCHTCVNNTGVWAIPAKRVDFDFTVDWEYDEKNDGCKYKFRKKTGKVM